ncbi:hypothetical protein ACERJO_11375 [Halalkalibacter sp. AB-rgal2]|uniref:hypothetical protein n=1 Tax=Halalkalibacter sp. AB-rgal2 TaxID=3242695 RepID=UPI00359D780F
MEWYDFVNIIAIMLMVTGLVFLMLVWQQIRKVNVGDRIPKNVAKKVSKNSKRVSYFIILGGILAVIAVVAR